LAKVHVEVYGCSANQADAEIASGLLAEAGHTLVDAPDDADVSVILTCVVKTPTERKIVRRLGELRGRGLVVAGCMGKAQMNLVEEAAPSASVSPMTSREFPRLSRRQLGERWPWRLLAWQDCP
jgi:tRNA A37 methylthiotransferase MiaB